jgi:tRNA 2-selenouridine synthase
VPVTSIEITEAVQLLQEMPVLDVRSPKEFHHAHIPGSISFPLFSDEERHVIGTAYKQEGREKAIRIGLTSFGSSLVQMVSKAEKIVGDHPSRELIVHCWRGGMRSGAVSWLLDFYGFKVYVIRGGYKSFRNFAISLFSKNRKMITLGGYTGSGKTEVLHELSRMGKNVIDLEGIASHKGSAFGHLGMGTQPGQEQFENILAMQLIAADKKEGPLWVESESQRIGNVNIPLLFFENMKREPLVFLNIPFSKRLDYITLGYGGFDKQQLMNGISRISKRLGGLEEKNALRLVEEGEIRKAFAILLKYYDKYYHKSTFQGDKEIERITVYADAEETDAVVNAEKVNQCLQQIPQ